MDPIAQPPHLPPQPVVVGYAPFTDVRDADHLRLLSIFHYVYGGIAAVVSCIFIIHILIGVLMLQSSGPFATPAPPPPGTTAVAAPSPPPPEAGWFFVVLGSTFILIGWTIAGLTIASGRCIARRRGRTFSLVVAGLNCLSVPLGTALGVFTFIVLLRDSVAPLYSSARR